MSQSRKPLFTHVILTVLYTKFVDANPLRKSYSLFGLEFVPAEFVESLKEKSTPNGEHTFKLTREQVHTMEQQLNTFEVLYPHVAEDGIYLCEDLSTSYSRRPLAICFSSKWSMSSIRFSHPAITSSKGLALFRSPRLIVRFAAERHAATACSPW